MHEIFDLDGSSVARIRISGDDVPELIIMAPATESEGVITEASSYAVSGWDALSALHEGLTRLFEARLLSGEPRDD